MEIEIINLKKENEELKNKIRELENKLTETEHKLKSYTNTNSCKKYYKINAETVKEKAKKIYRKYKGDKSRKIKRMAPHCIFKQKKEIIK